MPQVDVDGASLEYVETGAGDPVVMVHGAISDYRIWDAQREALGKRYRAIAYSCRHYWPNARTVPADGHPFSQHVDDLADLLTALDAAPAHLVGNSSGGLLCLLLATRAPELVRSLMLLEPFIMPMLVSLPPKPLELLTLGVRHPRTAAEIVRFGAAGFAPALKAYERGDAETALQIFTTAVFGPGGIERMTEAQRASARDNNFGGQFAGEMPRLDASAVRSLHTPMLLLDGDRSPALFRLFNDRLRELLPRAERVEIPDASHTPQVDNPAAVNAAILDFLARHGSPQPAA